MDLDLHRSLSGLKSDIEGYVRNQQSLQTQVDNIDRKLADRIGSSSSSQNLTDFLKQNDSVGQLITNRKGKAIINFRGNDAAMMERKTTLTATATGSGLGALGVQTTGVLPIDRISGITPEARQQLTIRDVLPARPTTAALVDFVRVTTPPAIASPQVEASAKAENALGMTAYSEKVRTIATWIPATRQVLDDFGELATFIDGTLRFYVDLAEELEFLTGDGTGEHVHGIIPQAASFTTSLLGSGWNRIDVVGRAIEQVANAKEFTPTFVVVNIADWWSLRLTKDGFSRYILGDPQSDVVPSIFGLRVVPTVNMASGTFLVGSGTRAAIEIVDRMETQVEVSTEHSDFFTKNLVAVRAEKRVALIVKRPSSFVYGTFTTSP